MHWLHGRVSLRARFGLERTPLYSAETHAQFCILKSELPGGGTCSCLPTCCVFLSAYFQVGLIRGLASELAQDRITCNIVAPGHIDTERPVSAGPRPSLEMKPVINRLGEGEEIASMIHFLCLPEADYITGQTMHVNGGLYYGV